MVKPSVITKLLILALGTLCIAVEQAAAKPPVDLERSLDLIQLKITMAEKSFQINPSTRRLGDLAGALEQFLMKRCFGNLPQTLDYKGPPKDPDCVARMDQLLQVYPTSPIGVCLRDGIHTESCKSAYQDQRFKSFSGSSNYEDIPDPALKVGLSANDKERLGKLDTMVSDVNKALRDAKTPQEQLKSLDDANGLYEQILGISCKISAISLEAVVQPSQSQDELPLSQIREQLLSVPPSLRRDYQDRFLKDAERELAAAKGDPIRTKSILRKIKVIENPETPVATATDTYRRDRVVLSECAHALGIAEHLLPNMPAVTCYRIGWYSPQCMTAIKKWRHYRRSIESQSVAQGGARPTPTPHPLISTF